MRENDKLVCSQILNRILCKPISRLFWNYSDDTINPHIAHPIGLEYVSTRLSQDKYSQIADFIYDLYTCIQNGVAGSPKDSIRYSSSQELLNELDSVLSELQPLSKTTIIPLRILISDFEEENIYPNFTIQTPNIQEPQSYLFNEEVKESPDEEFLTKLIRDIRFLTSEYLTSKVIVLIIKLQPESVLLEDSVSINFNLLTKENLNIIRKYVSDLLYQSASGQIDPFSRPFGSKVKPIYIQGRGNYILEQK